MDVSVLMQNPEKSVVEVYNRDQLETLIDELKGVCTYADKFSTFSNNFPIRVVVKYKMGNSYKTAVENGTEKGDGGKSFAILKEPEYSVWTFDELFAKSFSLPDLEDLWGGDADV